MDAVNILVDVQCIRPLWVLSLINDPRLTAMYRLYINDNLLTERTWAWTNNTFIQENIWIYAEKDSSHTVTIVPLLKDQSHGAFKIDNLIAVNTPFISEQINEHTISFTLQ